MYPEINFPKAPPSTLLGFKAALMLKRIGFLCVLVSGFLLAVRFLTVGCFVSSYIKSKYPSSTPLVDELLIASTYLIWGLATFGAGAIYEVLIKKIWDPYIKRLSERYS